MPSACRSPAPQRRPVGQRYRLLDASHPCQPRPQRRNLNWWLEDSMSWSLDQIEEKGSKYPTFARKPNCQAERMIGSQDSRLSRLGIISSTYSPLNGVTAANYSKVESVSETQEVWFPPRDRTSSTSDSEYPARAARLSKHAEDDK